jgi:hypothetical protein
MSHRAAKIFIKRVMDSPQLAKNDLIRVNRALRFVLPAVLPLHPPRPIALTGADVRG